MVVVIDFMKSGVRGKKLRFALSLAGGISALFGALLLTFVSFPTMLAELRSYATLVPQYVVYVSGEGDFRACMSCHTDTQWSNSARPLEITGEILSPRAVNEEPAADHSGGWAYRMSTSQIVHPFLSSNADLLTSYVLRGSMEEQSP